MTIRAARPGARPRHALAPPGPGRAAGAGRWHGTGHAARRTGAAEPTGRGAGRAAAAAVLSSCAGPSPAAAGAGQPAEVKPQLVAGHGGDRQVQRRLIGRSGDQAGLRAARTAHARICWQVPAARRAWSRSIRTGVAAAGFAEPLRQHAPGQAVIAAPQPGGARAPPAAAGRAGAITRRTGAPCVPAPDHRPAACRCGPGILGGRLVTASRLRAGGCGEDECGGGVFLPSPGGGRGSVAVPPRTAPC